MRKDRNGFKTETVVYIDAVNPSADRVVTFQYREASRANNGFNVRKALGLDGGIKPILPVTERGRLATQLRRCGGITEDEVSRVGGRIVRTKEK